jgi:hypothetical protein
LKTAALVLTTLLLTTPVWAQTPAPSGQASSAARGPVSVQLQIDKGKVEIGQSLRLNLDLRYPSNITLTPPPAEKFEFKPFDVQDSTLVTMPPESGMQHLRYSFKLAPFDFGTVKIPDQTIPFQLNGKPDNVTITGPSVLVSRMVPGKNDKVDEIRDLKEFEAAPFPQALLIALVFGGLLLLFLLYQLVRWLRRPKPKKAAPPVLPYPWAQQELSRLERERPDKEGRSEEFYERLTLILRTYLGWRYGRPLLEQTTGETLDSLSPVPQFSHAGRGTGQGAGLSDEHWNALRAVLEQADLVKFARLSPPDGRTEQHLEVARHLVEQNAPFEEHAGATR